MVEGVFDTVDELLTDFLSTAAAGLVVVVEAVPVVFDTEGGEGLTAPDPNVPELMI